MKRFRWEVCWEDWEGSSSVEESEEVERERFLLLWEGVGKVTSEPDPEKKLRPKVADR